MLRLVGEFLAAVVVGALAAVVPAFNNEAYLVATQGFGLTRVGSTVLGLAAGNTAGKQVLFELVRTGRRLPGLNSASPAYARRRRWSAALLAQIQRPGRAVAVTVLAAATGLPPYYAVTVIAAAGRMSRAWFAAAGFLGSLTRFTALALAAHGLLHPA